MKKSMKVATALAGAAVVVAGGSAFTAANTLQDGSRIGYDTATATGVVIDSTDYSYNSTNHTLTQVVFHTDAATKITDEANTVAQLELTKFVDPNFVVQATDAACAIVDWPDDTPTHSKITCKFDSSQGKAAPVPVADVDGMNLMVTSTTLP